MRRDRVATIALLAALAVGCGEKPPVGPTGGDLPVAYAGPSSNDGAILVLVSGTVESVAAVNGYQIASAPVGPNATRVVVTGSLAPGDLFKIKVKDISASYGAQIEAVADRTTFALGDPSRYQATVRK
ncbi:MAG: hypothetical protein ACKVZ0_24560 [Gemmatimonadales bacterium]